MSSISVIIPVYNVLPEHLLSSLNSLAAQTMQECEFIVVSDGASEAECAICEEYKAKDSRFKFFRREHAGVSATRNYGIKQAQGEYITFVDADDWIEKNTCQITYDFAKKNDSDIVLWDAYLYDNKIKSLGNYTSESIDYFSKEQIENLIQTAIFPACQNKSSVAFISCKLIKKDLLKLNHISFPTNLRCSEDRYFHIHCFLHSSKISYLKKNLYYYRIHNSSVSRKYTPHAYNEYTKFLSMLDQSIQKQYSKFIDLEYIHSFLLCWPTDYMNKENKASFLKRMFDLANLIKSENFSELLRRTDFSSFSFLVRIELSLFKKGITLPIYIHGLKALISSSK